MAWLKLIRWQNLLIIALTQFLVWWCVILPVGPHLLDARNFMLLMLSTVAIAAAGYIINDYFDIKIDQVNRPASVVLGKRIERRHAIIAHTILNLAAIAAAANLARQAGHYEWLLIQLSCTVLLWVYSTTYKRRYMSGNVIVSLLTAMTVLVLYVYEPALHGRSALPVWVLAVYAYFAFVLTWMREIVKDMEDLEGDEADGCVTMPISRGLAFATRFTSVLAAMAIVPLVVSAIVLYTRGYLAMSFYVLALLAFPLAWWTMYLLRGKPVTSHYSKCSRSLKMIMVLGICALLVHKFI